MLHELLFALHGYTGSIFTYKENEGITVIKSTPFLNPSEIHILDQLCTLGTYYKKFQDLLKRRKSDGCKAGLYLHAFCIGLDRVLDGYQQILNDLEKDVLSDPHVPLSHFQHHLAKYHLLFPALLDVVEQILCRKLHGCQILDVVYKASSNGICMVKTAMNKILHACHGVLYKQLAEWMLDGVLYDPYGEFFIQSGKLCRTNGQDTNSTSSDSRETENSLQKYQLYPQMLPTYIPLNLAEKMLFVGRSVTLFGKHAGDYEIENDSIFMRKQHEFANQLQKLHEREEFSSSELDAIVTLIRQFAAENLWSYLVEKADLIGHLKILRDIFLLGHGELFLTFIDQTSDLLKGQPTRNTEHGVNSAFRAAVRATILNEDSLFENVYLTIKLGGGSGDASGWSSPSISYKVPHTLQIFFTPSILIKYDRIFQFLFTVRTVQLELHDCWNVQIKDKAIKNDKVYLSLCHLRNHMTFFVDNLQYYLQVDVIESQFSLMMNKINSIKDFEAVQHAHEVFLSNIMAQVFLSENPKKVTQVYLTLRLILDQCLSLCSLAALYSGSPTKKNEEELKQIRHLFFLKTSQLFMMLPNVNRNQDDPSLAQFMLRIHYGKYFGDIKI